MLVAERNRLGTRNLSIGDVRGALQLEHSPQQRRNQKHGTIDRGAGNCVRAAMKNLHRSELSVQWERHPRSRVLDRFGQAPTQNCDAAGEESKL